MPKTRLTDAAVKKYSTPAKGKRREIQDSDVPQLWLRITDAGHKSWAVAYRYNGKQKRFTIGSYPDFGVAAAREGAREVLRLVAKGEDPNYLKREKIQSEKNYTFAAVVEEFTEKYAKPKNRTWEATKRLLDAHAVPIWGDMPIASIKRRDVIVLLDKMMEREKKHPTRHLFSALRKLFNWAAERNLIEISPCVNVRSPIAPNKREKTLCNDDIRILWQECDIEGAPFGTLLQFLLVTGQRLREASEMRWSEVNFREKLWSLAPERVKTKRSHQVPLSPLAIQLLQRVPRFEAEDGNEGGHFVFTTTGGRRPFSGFSKCKERVDSKTGITDWRIHDLRRTCGTNLGELGVPMHTISHVLNHAQSGVTSIYNRHSYLPEKREALEKWAEHLQKMISTNGTTTKK